MKILTLNHIDSDTIKHSEILPSKIAQFSRKIKILSINYT